MPVNQFDDNEFGWAADFNALSSALGGDGIVNGCSISKGTGDWDIDVTGGAIIESNSETSITSGTVTITDSSALTSGQSRITLIHVDNTDTLASTDGTAATDPASPDIPAGEVLLGFVVVADTDSTAADSDIIDIPVLMGIGGARSETIQIYSGAIANIPTGWVLCDGNNNTPNLQDKFVVGAGNTFAVDDTGGESTHTLTEAELASHDADIQFEKDNAVGGTQALQGASAGPDSTNTTAIETIGSDSAHENKPPYHALAYIMKT